MPSRHTTLQFDESADFWRRLKEFQEAGRSFVAIPRTLEIMPDDDDEDEDQVEVPVPVKTA
jgi:hypothetical protein